MFEKYKEQLTAKLPAVRAKAWDTAAWVAKWMVLIAVIFIEIGFEILLSMVAICFWLACLTLCLALKNERMTQYFGARIIACPFIAALATGGVLEYLKRKKLFKSEEQQHT